MQLHPAGAAGLIGLKLRRIGIHNEAHGNARSLKSLNKRFKLSLLPGYVKSTLGCHLNSSLAR